MNKAVIFDFDGVVINSIEVQKIAFLQSYKRVVGKECTRFDEFLSHSGNSLKNILNKMNLPLDMVEIYKKISSDNINKIKLHEGISELFNILKLQGVKCGLCTGKDRKRTLELLEKLNIYKQFDAIVCSDDVENSKPHPESLILCMNKLESDIKSCVMIGDAINDILCAKSAGVKNVCVTWGDTNVEVLSREKPDFIVGDTEELQTCIYNVLGYSEKQSC